MDYCYSYGLFNLKERYETKGIIADGGGWELKIEYVDGTPKTSTGNNAAPTKVFNKCATVFYDLCNDGVVGSVPINYYSPPGISVSFHFDDKNYYYSNDSLSQFARVNYKWNKFESLDNNIYSISNGLNGQPKFWEN